MWSCRSKERPSLTLPRVAGEGLERHAPWAREESGRNTKSTKEATRSTKKNNKVGRKRALATKNTQKSLKFLRRTFRVLVDVPTWRSPWDLLFDLRQDRCCRQARNLS